MRPFRQSRSTILYFLTVVFIIAGSVLRLTDLDSDPPMYYSGAGQSLSTDPALYTYHARNKALFDDWDPFDSPHVTVFRHSLVSYLAYASFPVTGVSLRSAALVGVLLSIGGLLFLLASVARYHSPGAVALTTLALMMNVTLITYGRLAYLENGLLLLGALLVAVYVRWPDKVWAAFLAGLLAAAAAFGGKLFGILLLPVLMAATWTGGGCNRKGQMAAILAGAAIGAGTYVGLLYGGGVQGALSYFGDTTVGLHGIPRGILSPWDFVEHLISYGYANRLTYLNPDIALMSLAGGFLLILSSESQQIRLTPISRFCFFWLLVGFAVLAPLNYSPLRYALFLIPPAAILCFTLVDSVRRAGDLIRLRLRGWRLPAMTMLIWYTVFHLAINLFFSSDTPAPQRLLIWTLLPVAIAAAIALRALARRGMISISSRALSVFVIALIAVVVVNNVGRIWRYQVWEKNYTIAEANLDLPVILAGDAVLSGSYGTMLTVDNRLQSFVHFLGAAVPDGTLFDRQPITHIAIDAFTFDQVARDYPAIRSLMPIVTYWIRDVPVSIYNVSKVFGSRRARAYVESAYEEAVRLYHEGNQDSALMILQLLHEEHPESKAIGLLSAEIAAAGSRYSEVYKTLKVLSERYPTDFHIHLQCGRALQIQALASGDSGQAAVARTWYNRAIRLNPYKRRVAERLWRETQQQGGKL